MILTGFMDLIYNCALKIFNICIIRIPMGILITTIILSFLITFYINTFFYSISGEKQEYSFIQNRCLCHTIFIKLFLEKTWREKI